MATSFPVLEELHQLYNGNRIQLLEKLWNEGMRGPYLPSMLSGYYLKQLDVAKAAQYIPAIEDEEERCLKWQTVEYIPKLTLAADDSPRVHLLLLACNRVDYIDNALRQLAATDYTNYAVYILDNGSTDGTAELVHKAREYFPAHIPVSVETLPMNIGRPLGHNWLLTHHDHSTAEFIAIGDDDLIDVPTNWLKKMLATARLFPQAAAIGGKALNQGARVIHGGVRRLVHFSDKGMEMTNSADIADVGQMDYIDRVDHVIGCLHIYRRDMLFDTVGLFDLRYSPCQCVDIDHHLTIRLAGLDIVYNGLIEFVHARAMGKAIANDRASAGNSLGNLIKLLYKHDADAVNALVRKDRLRLRALRRVYAEGMTISEPDVILH